MNHRTLPVLVLTGIALLACSSDNTPSPDRQDAAPNPVAAHVVAEDLGDATAVAAARAGGATESVTVVGRIADVVDGFAAFTLMDTALPYCGEKNPEDNCDTPWDYCCESPEDKRAHSLLVEIHGADGKPLRASELPDLRLLDMVQVAGRIAVDDQENPVLIADRVHRAARPELKDGLDWPR